MNIQEIKIRRYIVGEYLDTSNIRIKLDPSNYGIEENKLVERNVNIVCHSNGINVSFEYNFKKEIKTILIILNPRIDE